MKTQLFALAASLTLSISAAQASHTFATSSPGEQHFARGEYVNFEIESGEHYNFHYFFSLSSPASLSATAVINTASGKTTDTDWLRLYKYTLNSSQPPGPSIDGRLTSNSTSSNHIFHNLQAGTYYYEIYGISSSDSTNQVSFQSHIVPDQAPTASNVSAIPEPATYALLAAGLGLVAIRGRRHP